LRGFPWSIANVRLLVLFVWAFAQGALAAGPGLDPEWFRHARIGGVSVSGWHVSDYQMKEWIDDQIKMGVNVIEADSRFSDYLTEEEFDQEVEVVRRFCKFAHDKGVKVVWYIPALEVITADGKTKKDSFGRQHPDWIQLSFDGKEKNIFYGQRVFWVEPKDESAWLCPNGPYRDYFFDHIKKMAAAGLDGLWVDVPITNLIIGQWGCADIHCRRKFESQTGLPWPRRADLSDPLFFKYVKWRHRTIRDFLVDATTVIRSVAPESLLIAEIVTLDHIKATECSADGTYFNDVPGLRIVWEVDCVSDTSGMADGSLDDWFSQMTVFKWCQGTSSPSGCWSFSYGFRPDDAQLVMASCLSAQINPYELRVPQMTSTVSSRFRKTMFEWVKAHQSAIFDARSNASVAIVYSSDSRDLVDGAKHGGYFASWARPQRDLQWFTSYPAETVYLTDFLAEYRGWAKLMIRSGIPYDMIPIGSMDASRLSQYKVLVLPEAAVLDERDQAVLMSWVSKGGRLVVTGRWAGQYSSDGCRRKSSLWSHLDAGRGGSFTPVGQGGVCVWKGTPGREYMRETSAKVERRALSLFVEGGAASFLPRREPVHVQLYSHGDALVLHATHYGWVGRHTNVPRPISARFSVPLPRGRDAVLIVRSAPGEPDKTIAFSREKGRVVFDSDLLINALFSITTAPGGPR